MHHAALVGEAQAVGHLDGDAHGLRHRQGAVAHALAQVGALEQLHGEVGEVAVLAEVVGGDDVRVRELAGGARLEREALLVVAARAGVLVEQDGLQRDDAVQGRVLRLVDDAHGAAAELAQDLVAADLLARRH
jgi:hypothetical protein